MSLLRYITRIWTLVAMLFTVLMANAQNTTLEEEPDTTISVVGYFCKNDTMTFRNHQIKQKIIGNDTTLTYDQAEEFMIVVTDSTSEGYRMEYIPVSHVHNTKGDTLTTVLREELWKIAKDVHCIFTTDELGQVQHIENWREIRDVMKKGIPQVLDRCYSMKPGLDAILPRRQYENMLLMQCSTENNIRKAYDKIDQLFGLHGHNFDIGEKEVDDKDNGYPQHIIVKVGYTEQEEDSDIEGDYAIMSKSVTTMPTEDAAELLINLSTFLLKDNLADSIYNKKSEMIDSMKTVIKDQNITITQNEYSGYFYNGWPKSCYTEKITDVGIVKVMELDLIEWIYRYWNIYETKEDNSYGL